MNIREYISSGIIESYVLGLADDHERSEFEEMCDLYPEVLQARTDFELLLEAQAATGTLEPPSSVKEQLLSSLAGTAAAPTTDEQPAGYGRPAVRMSSRNPLRVMAVAASVLLCLSVLLNIYLLQRYRTFSKRYEVLLATQSQIAQRNDVLQARLLAYERAAEMMKDPQFAIVKMRAMPGSPDSASTSLVYWNTVTKDVYLAGSQLPAPPAGRQYQLWAIADGKPVDAGVFEMGDALPMVRMKKIMVAQAFAITLEKEGGSPTPSMDKMYVMGKL